MSTIVDYNTLANAVRVYCARTDNIFNTQIPTFVGFAEDRILDGVGDPDDPLYSAPLRVPEMYGNVSIPPINDVYTIPGDCMGIRVLDTGQVVDPDYMAPDQFRTIANQPSNGSTSVVYYTVEGTTIKVWPIHDVNLELGYWQRPMPINAGNTTNSLLFTGTKYGNIYLAATMFEAMTWLQKEGAAAWLTRLRSAVSGANKSAESVRRGGGKRRMTPVQTIGAYFPAW